MMLPSSEDIKNRRTAFNHLKALRVIDEVQGKGYRLSEDFHELFLEHLERFILEQKYPTYFNEDDIVCCSIIIAIVDWMKGVDDTADMYASISNAVNWIFLFLMRRLPKPSTVSTGE